MKKFNFFRTLSCVALVTGLAQLGWSAPHSPEAAQASASSAARAVSSSAGEASTRGQSAEIRNGTKISAQLMSNVNARTAKPGDKVAARVTKNVKQHGRIVVHKGDKIIGHITSVKTAANGKADSALGVRFDQLVSGHSTTQLNTVLTSILSVPGFGSGGPAPMQPPSMPAPVAAPAGGGGGKGPSAHRSSVPMEEESVLRLVIAVHDRPAHRRRLDARLSDMLARGFLDEVRALYERGDLDPSRPAIRAVGYRQLWECCAGRRVYEEAVERARIATAQLAKRQSTWIRSLKGWRVFPWESERSLEMDLEQEVDKFLDSGARD